MKKDTKQPLLSICIPTYNRADVLKICLSTIVASDAFRTGDVEVVIGDNYSTDNTQEVISEYSMKYPNIIGYHNEENIGAERNFIRILSFANGKFRKLHNDYSIFTPHGLDVVLQVVRENEHARELIFFQNSSADNELILLRNLSMSKIVELEAWNMAWLGNYGFWEEDWETLENKDAKIETLFLQIDYFMRILERKKTCVLAKYHYSTRYPFEQKQGGYNFFKVHIENFFSLFDPYYKQNLISNNAYNIMKKNTCIALLPFVEKFYFLDKDNYTYDLKNWLIYFVRNFWIYPWFYKIMIKWMWRNKKHLRNVI